MLLPLAATGVLLLPTLLLGLAAVLVAWLLGRSPRRLGNALLWIHVGLLPLHLLVTFPAALGYVGSRWIGTRNDERGYEGPRLDGEGRLWVQDRDTLARERQSAVAVPAAVLAAARARAVSVASSDGTALRVFRIEPRAEPPAAVAVLVHGLFRSAMEVEPVAAMLRERNCECWLVELRGHGGSARAPFTGGLTESDDVVAAVAHVRRQPGRAGIPLILYGVSLGTAAVALALPRIDGLAGVVLDAPIDDLTLAAHRMLTFERPGDRRSWTSLREPWRSLVLTALGAWSGFDVADVSPGEVLATLPPDLPVILIGAGDDDRAPPASVRRLFDRLPMAEPTKRLWIEPGVGHGQVFLRAPARYAALLGEFLGQIRRP